MSTPAEAPGGEVLLYEAPDGKVRVDVRLEQDTVWLTQRQMSEIFGTTPENVLMHLKNVFGDGELEEAATAKDFLVVQTEGNRQVRRNLKHYNLDAIISVGYRVNSRRGVRFRQWATRVLREHLVQGCTFNQTRLAERGLLEARQTFALLAERGACDFTESVVEEAALAWLEALGYAVLHGPDISPGSNILTPALSQWEREKYSDVVLERRVRDALAALNPALPAEALEDAFRKLTRSDAPSLPERRRLHLQCRTRRRCAFETTLGSSKRCGRCWRRERPASRRRTKNWSTPSGRSSPGRWSPTA